mmetsp:Transcript_21579/g.37057  ORF Transcript_21579/g.37057 Transcript_21579/m.37057 type:complete len:145 (+) Transcript_21579:108-542(+)
MLPERSTSDKSIVYKEDGGFLNVTAALQQQCFLTSIAFGSVAGSVFSYQYYKETGSVPRAVNNRFLPAFFAGTIVGWCACRYQQYLRFRDAPKNTPSSGTQITPPQPPPTQPRPRVWHPPRRPADLDSDSATQSNASDTTTGPT